jgi:hypothetical protein
MAIAVVTVHVAAAILVSFLKDENLIKSMVTGKKMGTIDQAIPSPVSLVGFMLALAWVYTFYLVVSGALPVLTQ